jgi:hypothetical protein
MAVMQPRHFTSSIFKCPQAATFLAEEGEPCRQFLLPLLSFLRWLKLTRADWQPPVRLQNLRVCRRPVEWRTVLMVLPSLARQVLQFVAALVPERNLPVSEIDFACQC